MLRLLIARHGNTFDAGQTVCRVGLRTDLPLSKSGIKQAENLGLYLQQYPEIKHVYCSELKRTKQTAQIALEIAKIYAPITALEIFNEVDYGIDDGKPETEVIERLGAETLAAWDQFNIVPNGWNINVAHLKQNWLDFTNQLIMTYADNNTVLVVTSNGIAKFALNLLSNPPINNNKISTGAVCELQYYDQTWHLIYWNQKPTKTL